MEVDCGLCLWRKLLPGRGILGESRAQYLLRHRGQLETRGEGGQNRHGGCRFDREGQCGGLDVLRGVEVVVELIGEVGDSFSWIWILLGWG